MKSRILLALIACVSLSACSTAGLNVSWSATASYNTNVTVKTEAVHQTSPVQGATVPAAPAPASAASAAK